jgi:hypothetical protein
MTYTHMHLTEDERQTLADGSMPEERAHELDAHLRECETCAADVARLKRLMTRLTDSPRPDAPLDEMWPGIRSRIEQSKVIPLDAKGGTRRPSFTTRHVGIVSALIAAAAVLALVLRPSKTIRPDLDVTPRDSVASVMAIADSLSVYEEESRTLLNRIEVQRAMMRPETRASVDRDLKVIDDAIAELREAIANDPRNPALRQLLAASYRQKVELLKRVGNAS